MTTIGRRSLSFALLFLVIVAAAAKAYTGKAVSVTGEIVETYCWAVHEVGGTGHAQCGIECAKRGLPVALYDPKSRVGYILLPARDKASLPPELVAAMGRKLTVQGELVTRGGIQLLIVQSWRSAK